MIKIEFFTNLDLHSAEKWPTELPESPIVGDTVQSAWSGVPLKVVNRKWVNTPSGYVLRIELHDNPAMARSVREFEEVI